MRRKVVTMAELFELLDLKVDLASVAVAFVAALVASSH
jgi:hypothetical protein